MEQAVADGDFLDCDGCGKPMSFETYASHACDGLRGLNPLQEKMKKARWKIPGGVSGSVSAVGRIRPASRFERILDWLKGLG